MRSREVEPRRAAAPETTHPAPRRALRAGPGRVRAWRLLGALGIVASFFAGLLAGPLLGIDPGATNDADAATAAIVRAEAPTSATAVPTASPSVASGGSGADDGTASSEPDCRGAKDTRSAARKKPFTVCGTALISKEHRVSAAYTPTLVTVNVRSNGIPNVLLQPVAGKALKKLFAAATKAGHTLVVRSSYRSYATQVHWYATMDQRLTAPAGASEHQSGLAVDLAGISNGALVHGTVLARSPIGKWLVKHAPAFGFILRYPSNQSKITGIVYEPWHFRYVGTEVAEGVVATKTKTLEQYLKET
ncbi:MAG: M15 family metallopeptidase [Propionibacteriaceae bacterium]|nr:M15 family metallopeptidase [Propionibacteriaceae bacterium]